MAKDVFCGSHKGIGKLVFIVASKIMGIETTKRKWKIVTTTKFGNMDTTRTLKYRQQSLVYDTNQQLKSRLHYTRLSSAGRLWNDKNLKVAIWMNVFGHN